VSRANVEIVRRMYEAYARADFELSLSYLDPDIEFSQPAEEPGAGTYHGHQGVIQAFANWMGTWEDYRVEVEELTDLGDHVLARTRHHGRGKGSGVEVEQRIFQLWSLQNDKVVRARMYYDEAEALEAAGRRKPHSSAGE
jgi:ketosteroid isomerase-like protein